VTPQKKVTAKKTDWTRVALFGDEDASIVPHMLTQLLGDEKAAVAACSFFMKALVREDSLAPGAKVIAPLLAPIANDWGCKVHGQLFTLIGMLACGGSPSSLLFATRDLPVDRALVSAAKRVRAEAISRSGEHKEASRIGAAFLFATLREDPQELLAILRATLKPEKSAVVRAVILFSIGILGRGKVKTDARLFNAAIEAETPIERLAGLYGLARLGPLAAQARTVIPGLLEAAEPVQSFPWEHGDIPALATRVLRASSA
jgi:hypothetical protein